MRNRLLLFPLGTHRARAMQTQMKLEMHAVGGCTLCKPNQEPSGAGPAICPTHSRDKHQQRATEGRGERRRKAMSAGLHIKAHPSHCCFPGHEQ